ncbi:hypothetical protein [Cysteiniphilum marinum]|uniref:hypothetical protein n=1 Tax=Cysteiniphilum marinum TaxID=2774191 RepID=UPI00193A43D1|nr:hypothetical protein [Cysteiniphilum marinum]
MKSTVTAKYYLPKLIEQLEAVTKARRFLISIWIPDKYYTGAEIDEAYYYLRPVLKVDHFSLLITWRNNGNVDEYECNSYVHLFEFLSRFNESYASLEKWYSENNLKLVYW